MGTFVISIFAFIFAIGILVVFHEFGHFWVARRFGVKVLRFSVGFGKILLRWKDKHQTEYVLSAVPLGGYVKMLDEREGEVPEHQKKFAFNRKSVWVRFAIVLAGPLFNFLFAFLAFWLMFIIGISGWIPLVGEVKEHSIAATSGVMAGEEIISVEHIATNTWQQVIKELMKKLGDRDALEIQGKQTDGSIHNHHLNLQSWELKGDKPDLLHALGIVPYQPPIPPIIIDIIEDEPAAKAGVKPQDEIITVNGKPISAWKEFTDIVVKSADQPVTIQVKRNNEILPFTFKPRLKESSYGEMIGFAGLTVKTLPMPDEMIRKEQLGPFKALPAALLKTKEYIGITFKVIGKMLMGEIGLRTLSGPITIAQGAGATVIIGIAHYLGFLGLISVSLGVLNLLPIPILDGGHLLYYGIEMITGKPVSERIQAIGFQVGMLILIFLMTVAFYNDLVRLF